MTQKPVHNLPDDQFKELFTIGRSLRLGSWLIMLFLCFFIIWSLIAELDEVVTATGVVAPQEQVKVIQHLEGGILEEILVHEGDRVSSGQVLLKLSLGLGQINREEKQAELDSLLLTRIRLQAQLKDKKPDFPDSIAQHHPALVSAEKLAYISQHRELKSSLEVAQTQINQKKLEISELEAKLKTLKREKSIQYEQYHISKDLLSKGLTSKLEHLQIKATLETLTGQLNILKSSIPKAQSAHREALAKKEEIKEKFHNNLSTQLSKAEQYIVRITELLAKVNAQRLRTQIKSPINGIVKKMRYNTIQGVIRPGDAILEIVPDSNNLIIEAELNPADRGYIKEGQKAIIKVTTYDYSRYGGLDGTVLQIGADTLTHSKSGYSYYEVDIKTKKNYLGDHELDYPISSGMEASIEIHTGTRTVFEYLLKPFLKIKNEAFQER